MKHIDNSTLKSKKLNYGKPEKMERTLSNQTLFQINSRIYLKKIQQKTVISSDIQEFQQSDSKFHLSWRLFLGARLTQGIIAKEMFAE
jgi:hypothetical protein